MMLSPDTIIGDRYIVKRKLAEGGMAEIYLCTAMGPEGFEKEVVIKRIRSFWGNDDMFIQMFIAEARLASRLNHANIVQIFHFDKHEDSYYLAMEYVNGPSFRDFLRKTKDKNKPLPILLASEVAANIARGLHYAHNLGIVHRDVSPHNILLSFDGNIKLADFGIAKTGSQHTSPGVLKGKFAYMAPEQARGEAVDARTDIFALGIVLWEALTRSRLFEYDSYINALQALQENLIVQPSRFNAEVPEELDRIVLKALNRNPAERYQTAQEFERALFNFILTHARSADDTNLGHFLQTVYEDIQTLQQEKKDSLTRTYTPSSAPAPSSPPSLPASQKLAPIFTRPSEPAYAPRPAESTKQQPATFVQPKNKTSVPSLVPELHSPIRTTEEFAPEPEKTAATRQHKSPPSFLRHPVSIFFAIVVSAGIGVYGTLHWENLKGLFTSEEPPHGTNQGPKNVAIQEPQKDDVQPPVNVATTPPVSPPPSEKVNETPTPSKPFVEPAPPRHPFAALQSTDPNASINSTPLPPVVVPPPPPVTPPVTPPSPPPAVKEAKLIISASPWAMVSISNTKFVDVEVVGRREFRLPHGTYRVKLWHSSKEEVKPIQIRQGQDYRITFNAASP